MKISFQLLGFAVGLLCATFSVFGQAPAIEWQKCLGGTDSELAYEVQQTQDGGFIVVGVTNSNNGDVSGNHGGSDIWVVKLDAMGNLIWQKALGGSLEEWGHSIQEVTGGYVIAGYTSSDDGDVTDNNGNDDAWIIKIDPFGDIIWERTFGGTSSDGADKILQTSDGGYIVAGWSLSNDGDVSDNNGTMDCWILKLDPLGDLIWEHALGGSEVDRAYSIAISSNGSYLIAGWTRSDDGDVVGNNGGDDFWILELDTLGNFVWQKPLGGSDDDIANSMIYTPGQRLIVAGGTASNDGDVTNTNGGGEYWLTELDTSGNLLWQQSYGGSSSEYAYSITQTADSGYFVFGSSLSNDLDVSTNNGEWDYWLIKLDPLGNIIWEKAMGGSWNEIAGSVRETTDGGAILAGGTDSNDGDVSGNHSGFGDMWIVKLSGVTTGIHSYNVQNSYSVHPNPVRTTLQIEGIKDDPNIDKYEITDLSGKLILTSGILTRSIDVSELNNGTYLLNILQSNGRSTLKFVKE